MIHRAQSCTRHSRRGTALVAALQFLAVLSLMVAGSLFVVRGSRRASDLLLHDARLTGAADAVLARELARWDGARRARQRVGSRDPGAVSGEIGAALHTTVAIVRLSRRLFRIAAEVSLGDAGEERRRVALLVRLHGAPPRSEGAAIVSRGDVAIDGSARVLGDTSGCATSDSASPRVIVGTSATVALNDPRAPDDTVGWVRAGWAADIGEYAPFGNGSWSDAVKHADRSFGASETVTLEQAPNQRVAHASGDLTVEGGAWRGVLLVEGRLRVTGAAYFEGIVIARGGIELDADGVEVNGALMSAADASGVSPTSVVIRRTVTVRASSCAVEYAFAAAARVRRVSGNAWSEMLGAM
jgi:hypothetical protein